MNTYFVKTPNFIPRLFRNQVWRFSSEEKNIYLTFDDGPTPEITHWVLDTLEEYNAKATFFCIGKNIEQHPEIFQNILEQGHSVGNHTYNHEKGWKTATEVYMQSILKTETLIRKFRSSIPKSRNKSQTLNLVPQTSNLLFRPPYGKIKPSQTKRLLENNYQLIMWSVLSGDFDTAIDANKCLENVIKNTNNGSILVFHDSVKAFDKLQTVLPKVLAHFCNKGYTFKSIGHNEQTN